jgi:hypothetical protein
MLPRHAEIQHSSINIGHGHADGKHPPPTALRRSRARLTSRASGSKRLPMTRTPNQHFRAYENQPPLIVISSAEINFEQAMRCAPKSLKTIFRLIAVKFCTLFDIVPLPLSAFASTSIATRLRQKCQIQMISSLTLKHVCPTLNKILTKRRRSAWMLGHCIYEKHHSITWRRYTFFGGDVF